MPTMTDRQSIGANTTSGNLLAGKLHEFLSEDSITTLYATAAAVGVFVSLLVGGEVIIDDQEINAQNRMPLIPDDFVAQGAGFAGDRLILRARNSTAAAIVTFTRLDTEPA